MFAIQSSTSNKPQCTPNIVPCRIHYDGPTKVTKRFWNPTRDQNKNQTAFFRGRKLRGRAVKLPDGYQGLILKSTSKTLPRPAVCAPAPQYDDEDDSSEQDQGDEPEPVKILEDICSFNELLVWGHDQLPASDDAFVKNVEEWIGLAEAIHGKPKASATGDQQDRTVGNEEKP